jgi:hypothetical protein
VGRVDLLVLLGDIIDLSIASYEDAFRAARAFFRLVAGDGLAREVLYVPGNHDFEIWHTVEYQVNVIRQIEKGRSPRPFRRAVPAVLDERPAGARKLVLPDVAAHPERPPLGSDYGGLFLDHLAPLVFLFAYPNLYVVGEDGECVLITHGHYFERYWTLLGDLALRFAADDLGLDDPDRPSLRDLVGMNLPFNHLGSAGIGQAQPLTRLARTLQLEVSRGSTDRLEKYLDRMGHAALAGKPEFPGAEVVLYETGRGFWSESIRATDWA